VVTFGRDAAHHDGHRYASRLRQASVDVEELRYDAPEHPDVVPPGDGGGDRLVCDLARSIHGTRVDQGPQHLQPGERERLGVTSQ
jgi:acetyl esterase/lipase